MPEVIRKRNLIAIEDDNCAAILKERLPPLTVELPENGVYTSPLSNLLCPGR